MPGILCNFNEDTHSEMEKKEMLEVRGRPGDICEPKSRVSFSGQQLPSCLGKEIEAGRCFEGLYVSCHGIEQEGIVLLSGSSDCMS